MVRPRYAMLVQPHLLRDYGRKFSHYSTSISFKFCVIGSELLHCTLKQTHQSHSKQTKVYVDLSLAAKPPLDPLACRGPKMGISFFSTSAGCLYSTAHFTVKQDRRCKGSRFPVLKVELWLSVTAMPTRFKLDKSLSVLIDGQHLICMSVKEISAPWKVLCHLPKASTYCNFVYLVLYVFVDVSPITYHDQNVCTLVCSLRYYAITPGAQHL